MGQYYQNLDHPGGFDYELHAVPGLGPRLYRGPPVDIDLPFVACVGAAQTFGRFTSLPFPELLGRRLGVPVLNLGVGGAGPRHFEQVDYIALINRAELAIIQVLSGRSASNSLFDNSQSGGLTGRLRADNRTIRADAFFSDLSGSAPRARMEQIVRETREDYLASFSRLLKAISVPKILLWLSTRAPAYSDDFSAMPHGVFRAYPQLVNRDMVDALKVHADAYVECVSTSGLPQRLWPGHAGIDGAVQRDDALWNNYYPSPEIHAEAANALEAKSRRFLGVPAGGQDNEPKRFVIVGASRTGTNLLIGLVNDYPACFAGSELFNAQNIADDIIPWHDVGAERAVLLSLRRTDPVRFWQRLSELSEMRGYKTIGFKLHYSHGLGQEALLDHLAADTSIAIIHMKRRNLLRREVSERQAIASGRWATPLGEEAPETPTVELTAASLVTSVRRIADLQQRFDEMFAQHPTVELFYEDLARRPLAVARRVARFLGLGEPGRPLSIKHRKTGKADLANSIADYETLKTEIARLRSFFED